MPAGKDKLFPWFLRRALGAVSAFFMYPFDWLRGGCSSDTAFGADGNAAADPQAEVGENAAVAGAVKVARAEGVFSYDQ